MTVLREITVQEFIDALEKNGFAWAKGSFLNDDGSSCAIGQAARNLGYGIEDERTFGSACLDIQRTINRLQDLSITPSLTTYNDDPDTKKYEDVVAYAKEVFAGKESETITIYAPIEPNGQM